MRRILIAVSCVLLSIIVTAQPKSTGTTSELPKGTFFKNGAVCLSPGYKVTFSKDGKVASISKQNGNGVTSGRFACSCADKDGDNCSTTTRGEKIICTGDACCSLLVMMDPSASGSLATSGSADSVKWKTLIIPKTTIKTTSN